MIIKLRITLLFLIFFSTVSLADTLSIPLKNMMPADNIVLSGKKANSDRYGLKIPIPDRWEVFHGKISFSYINSSALIKKRSVLTVTIDKIPLIQIFLDPRTPKGATTVDIPGNLLKAGYHDLGFEVTQYSDQGGCEDPKAPELWTIVKLGNAKIEFNYLMKPVPLKVSGINEFIFDPKNPSPPVLNFVFGKLNPKVMKSVSLCASAVALRYDYRSFNAVAEENIRAAMDTVLLGDEEFIRKKLKEYNFNRDIKIDGPHIEIFQMPVKKILNREIQKKDPGHALVIVTGQTDDEVMTAAKGLSFISLPLPDAKFVNIRKVDIPEILPAVKKNGLTPGNLYTLASLGFESTTFKGMITTPKGFSFWIPSESHLTPDKHAILSLDIAYGASMRKDSVLNIELNEKFVAAIPCDDPLGGSFKKYKVRLFMSSLRPGYNKINFIPQLTTFSADKCSLIQTGNLRLSIFDNSTFSIPVVDNWIEMPQLSAFMGDGFPFTKSHGMKNTLVIIPDKTKNSFLTAVNLLAVASQRSGFPPFDAEWSFFIPKETKKNIVFVSKQSFIPEAFGEKAPIKIGKKGIVRSPHLKRARGHEDIEQKGFFSRLFSRKTRIKDLQFKDSTLVVVYADPVITDGRAVLTEFQSPYSPQATVMMLTTETEKDMVLVGKAVWDSGVQAMCKGDTVLVDLRKDKFEAVSYRLGKSYYIGKVSPVPFTDYYANSYPLLFIIVVIGFCFVLSFGLYQLLKKLKAKRFNDDKTE